MLSAQGHPIWIGLFASLAALLAFAALRQPERALAWAAGAAVLLWAALSGIRIRRARRPDPGGSMEPLATEEDLDQALRADRAWVFKHSLSCPVSARALGELRRFLEGQTAQGRGPEVPVYRLDVQTQPRLTREVADRLSTPHQSPQLLVLERGVVTDELTHGAIRGPALARLLHP